MRKVYTQKEPFDRKIFLEFSVKKNVNRYRNKDELHLEINCN